MTRRLVSVVVGIAITAAVVWYLLTPDVLREFRSVVATARASWPMLALAIALTVIVQWLRAWRFAIMTNRTFDLPGWPLLRIAFQLNFLSYALPFRLGELGYPVMMRRAYGHPIARSLGVLLLARLFDLFSVAAIFLFLAVGLGLGGTTVGSLALLAGAILLTLIPVAMVFGAQAARPFLKNLPAESRLVTAIEPSLAALGAHRTQLPAIALSFAIWVVFGGLASLAASAVASGISPMAAMLGAAAGNVAFALPVNGIGGLGASQAAWVLAVSRAGVPWSDAVISAFALYAVTLTGAMIFGGLATIVGASAIRRGA
jgi:uncharacterized membrane protein YbhN (UPF0104 family)